MVLDDGRVMYHRWEYIDKGSRVAKSVWAMNPDGTKPQELYGLAHDDTTVCMYPQPLPGSNHRFVCVGTGHYPQGGCLGPILLVDFGMGVQARAGPDEAGYVQGDDRYPVVNITPHVFLPSRVSPRWDLLTEDGKYVHDEQGRKGHLYTHPYPVSDREFWVWYKVNASDHYKDVANRRSSVTRTLSPCGRRRNEDPDRLMGLYKKAVAVFREHGMPLRQLPPVELEVSSVECGEHGSAPRRGRRVAEGGQEIRTALRRLGTHGIQGSLDPASPAPTRRGPGPACPTTAPIPSSPTSTASAPRTARNSGGASSLNGRSTGTWPFTELIDNYHPDLYYTDGHAPFSNEVGRRMIAHLYNSDIKCRGSLRGVAFT